ncbi:MAG: pyridoxal-phosphate dependent enzyme [Candidatus Thermoplasmatota archaeon]|jgi:threonine synthase|nr:pyridoxal-phosphate dependent enzyme [Candidatus Thermoplasmatota archaeon]MCL5790364.1 pyridoxal-phosphate dependent enzyme [Candidatus Thermoplasmatota archaeon]
MVLTEVVCSNCGSLRENGEITCNACGSPFIIRVNFEYREKLIENFPYISRYLVGLNSDSPVENVGETLIKSVFYTPTLSYKDIGMNNLFSYLVGKKVVEKGDHVSEDSSGNAGASFALFCKMASLNSEVFVSKTANPVKINQIRSYGARIHTVEGSREEVEIMARNSGFLYLGHQYWPEFYDGFRNISYGIFQNMRNLPSRIYIPFSTGTLYLGIYMGFKHLLDSGRIMEIPRLIAVQPKKACGMYNLIKGTNYLRENSIADALTGVIPLRSRLLREVISNHGDVVIVEEGDIIKARNDLLHSGIDTEYSSAIAFSAAKYDKPDQEKLVILTGHGIKNNFTSSQASAL